MSQTKQRIKIIFVQGSFILGGGERQIIYMLNLINKKKFIPYLIAFSNEGPLYNEIPKGVEVYILENKSNSRLKKIVSLLKVILSIKPQIVYSNLAGTSIPLALIKYFTKPILPNTKFIISVVNNVNFYRTKHRKLAFLLYKKFDYVLACSTGIYNQLIGEMKLKPNKTEILFNAVDIDFIEKKSKEEITHPWFSDKIPLIVSVGSLIPQKSMHDLISAFAIVNSKIRARLIIIGDGIERERLENFTKKLCLSDDVEFLGYQVNSNKYVAKANVFSLTSQFEGLATVLLESAITKTPIVCTNAPFGSADVVRNDNLGVLVKVGDIEGIAKGILKMIEDEKYAQNVSNNLFNHIKTEFGAQNVINKFEKILLKL